MEPEGWNVVVLGAWNRAILTPNWIARTVLALPEGAPADVLVPLDGFAQFQVHDRGLTVVPRPNQLLLEIAEPSPELLDRAMAAARSALAELSKTPIRACGINLRYSSDEVPLPLLERTRCSTERLFSDAAYEMRLRRRGETLGFHEGAINFIADIPTTGPCAITLNFDRQSKSHDEVRAWLTRPAAEYIAEAAKIIRLISE